VTRLSELPDKHRVAWDTETSGLYEDAGARISIVSWAYRDPQDECVVMQAIPFDQGFEVHQYGEKVKGKRDLPIESTDSSWLPLGPKNLPGNHRKRVDKWVAEHGPRIGQAPNQKPAVFKAVTSQLARMSLIGHQLKFDLLKGRRGLRGVEASTGIDLEPSAVADTMITQNVTEPRYPVNLKDTAYRLGLAETLGLEPGSEKDEQDVLKPWLGASTDPRYDLVPWNHIKLYAMLDSAFTLLLDEVQQDWFASGDPVASSFEPHVRREFNLMRVLYKMEVRGVGFDSKMSFAQAEIVKERMAAVASQLPFKVTPHGARKYFFGLPEEGGLGRIPYSDKMTAGGKDGLNPQPQVDDEVIARLAKDGVPHADLYAKHEKLKSANAKWYEGWASKVGTDGRIRMVHRQGTVVSGRLAAEYVQLHAIPQPYLTIEDLVPVINLFRAKPGHRLWSIDVSQAEIRIATAMAKCQQMLDLYLAGLDSHDAANLLMFGDELVPPGTADEPTGTLTVAKQHVKWGEYRQVAKRCNLGILYGAGVMTVRGEIAEHTGIVYPQKRVAGWIDDWRQAFPPFVDFLEAMQRVATNRGWVKLINGRIRYFSDYEPVHKAANQAIQGSQAEALKECMIAVERRYPGVLLLDIHDALWVEAPIEQETEIVDGVSRLMVDTFERMFARRWEQGGPVVTVPFAVDAKPVGVPA
jgi:DNA polymerase I-like protein with 3'-5' exonuclease and polymerase domains